MFVNPISQVGTLESHDEGLVFFMSIDGTHCPIQEPRPFSKEWSSHKFGGKPACNYEVGLLIHKPKLIWVHGPTRPGKDNDLEVFRQKLIHELPDDCRIIADGIYAAEPNYISTKNDLDDKPVWQFKNRTLARHENFNQRLKCFNVLKHRYRHGVDRHGKTFRACCVLLVFEIENGNTTLLNPYP